MPHQLSDTNNLIKLFLKYKRVIIYSLLLMLTAAGHYYFMQMPIELFRSVRWSVISMLSCLCLGGSIMLMAKKSGGRARALFAFAMFMIGLTSLLSLIKGLTTGYAGVVEYKFLSLPMLIYGSVYAFIFLLYPIEAFRPGWLTIKRTLLLFLTTIIVPLIYQLVIKLHDLPLQSPDNRMALSHDFWNHNVWVPLLILAYPVFSLVIMLRYRKNYKKWCENNYASMENMDIKWLGDYIFSNFVITLSCYVVVLSDNVRSVLMHNIIFLIFFFYGFYRVLFQKTPYPEGYFKVSMNETKAEISELMNNSNRCRTGDEQTDTVSTGDNDLNQRYQFTNKLPEYKTKLEQWMLTEKPYLRKDFKLTDAMEILPLNRSYLSRLFNEGYGETFYQFVMRYRIAESKHLLLARTDLNITCIADLSGFSSPSVFSRAFVQETSYTPLQWREKELVGKFGA